MITPERLRKLEKLADLLGQISAAFETDEGAAYEILVSVCDEVWLRAESDPRWAKLAAACNVVCDEATALIE